MFSKWTIIQFIQFAAISFGTMAGIIVPPSPCPQIFEYKNTMHGVINVPASVYHSFHANQIIVIAVLRVGGYIVNSRNTGKLELLYDINTTLERMARKQPIMFRIDFPRYPIMPSVVNITVNGLTICDRIPSYVIAAYADIRLQCDFLYPATRQLHLSPTKKPAVVEVTKGTEQSGQRQSKSLPSAQSGCGRQSTIENELKVMLGGNEIERGTWPWLVAVFVKTPDGGLAFKCTGNLLSHRIVLSAARCFMQSNKEIEAADVLLSFGRHNLRDWIGNGKDLWGVERIRVHDDYVTDVGALQNYDSDIAILVTQEFIEYSAMIRPICLGPTDASSSEGLTGLLVTWRNPGGSEVVSVPHKLRMKMVMKDLCLNRNSTAVDISGRERTFCAEATTANGPCNSDSGNGLAIWKNEAWFLRGILNGCSRNRYAILTDTTKFTAWITKWINRFL